MSTSYKFMEPYTFEGKKVTLQNRIAMAPMTTKTSFYDGQVSNDEVEYYRMRSGVGMLITGVANVDDDGKGFEGELSGEEVEALVADFGEATRRAIEAGFDGVEINGANSYLIQQFFSPQSNRRTDKWGGDVRGRMAFPLAVIASVVGAVEAAGRAEGFIVGYRLSPEELGEPGITIEDTLQLVDALERGATIAASSSGSPTGSRR